eukprot:418009-Rhodomonas_salina.1
MDQHNDPLPPPRETVTCLVRCGCGRLPGERMAVSKLRVPVLRLHQGPKNGLPQCWQLRCLSLANERREFGKCQRGGTRTVTSGARMQAPCKLHANHLRDESISPIARRKKDGAWIGRRTDAAGWNGA